MVTLGGLTTAFALIAALIQSILVPNNVGRGVGQAFALLLLVIAIVVILLRRISFFRNLHSYLGPVVDVEKVARVKDLRAKMALFAGCSPEMVVFHHTIARDRPPAEILRDSEGKLHIVLRYEILVSMFSQSLSPEAIIWHEIGHFVQWDTRLGYWSLRAVGMFGVIAFWVAVGCSALAVVVVLVQAMSRGFTRTGGLALAIEISATLFLFGVFWFMRYWHRFCEFNGDLTATMAGYGRELIEFLGTFPDTHATKLRRMLGVHPSSARRMKCIFRTLKNGGPSIVSHPPYMRLRALDYILGLLIYIVPLWMILSLAAFVLTAISENFQNHLR
jgi:hypothetical protein